MERVMINDLVLHNPEENKVLVENQQIMDYDRIRSLQTNQFYIKGNQVLQRDIYLKHPLHYIFEIEEEDKEVRKDEYLDYILRFVFSEDNNCDNCYHYEAQEHLMSMTGDILGRETSS